jgi:hypothetical protein
MPTSVDVSEYTQKIDYDYSNTYVVYQGWAATGSSTASPLWRICKLSYNSNNFVTDIQWANGSQSFTAIWDDRASYNYS